MGSLKLCVVVLACALIFENGAFADLKISGSGRVRPEYSENKDLDSTKSDDRTFSATRFRINLNFNQKEKVGAFFQPQFTKVWGSPSGTSGSLLDTDLSVHQAFLKYMLSDSLALNVGRKELAYGEHLVVGSVGWHNVGRSFDLVKVRQSYGSGWFDFWISQVDGAEMFSGLYSSWEMGPIKEIDFYLLHNYRKVSLPSESKFTYGVRSKSRFDDVDYRVELTFQSAAPSNQMDFELGYSLGGFRFSAEYFRSSKDYVQLYPTAHKWLGTADYFARRNISGFRVGTSGKISESLTAFADLHFFHRTDLSAPAYNFSGKAYSVVSSSAKALAKEIDLSVKYRVDKMLSFWGGYSIVLPDEYLKQMVGVDTGSFAFLQMALNF